MPAKKAFARMLDTLEARYGPQPPPSITDPFEQILWENVAYLVSDTQRAVAFDALRSRVGLTPERILAAPPEVLREVAALGGILPESRVGKLLAIAEIARRRVRGSLRKAVRRPLAEAKRALTKFPGIGDPGAERILLFSGTHPILALDSNALRVLVRLGFGEEKASYAATYHSAQAAAARQSRKSRAWLVRAHLLLRRHGQELCRRADPRCRACPLSPECSFFRSAAV